MPVSKAVVPLLKGQAAKDLLRTLNSSAIKPYSDQKRADADKAVLEALKQRSE